MRTPDALGPSPPHEWNAVRKTHKDGSGPVLVRLSNNMVLNVNKDKMINALVGELVDASGELKVKDGQVKLQAVTPIEASSIPAGDPARNCWTSEPTGLKTLHRRTKKSAMSSR